MTDHVPAPPGDLVDGTWEFCRLLRRAGWVPTDELIEWLARAEIKRVLWP
jgi:hypothetical protein